MIGTIYTQIGSIGAAIYTRLLKKLFVMHLLGMFTAIFMVSCRPALPSEEGTSIIHTSTSVLNPTPKITATDLLVTITPIKITPRRSPTVTPTSGTADLSEYKVSATHSLSPGGSWSAVSMAALPISPNGSPLGDQYFTILKLNHLISGEEMVLEKKWDSYGLGYTTPKVIGWSKDEGYVFVSEIAVPDGCGMVFVDDIRRIDLSTGEGLPINDKVRGPLAVSPAGDKLAFVEGENLVIIEMGAGEGTRFQLEDLSGDWWPSTLVWSPDADYVMLSTVPNPCSHLESQTGSLYIVDLHATEVQERLLNDSRSYSIVIWPEEHDAMLEDRDGQIWWLDTLTGQVSQSTPDNYAGAEEALLAYFSALVEGRYSDVDPWYGGDYDLLESANPGIDPLDRGSLWRAACQVNGYQCLEVASARLVYKPTEDTYIYMVTFLLDGETFQRGPCCGADILTMPPQNQFNFTVKREPDGRFQVIELPVYVP